MTATALAAPAPVCDSEIIGDEVTVPQWGTKAAAAWSVQCPEARNLRAEVTYVTGRTVVAETDVAAGEQWEALDFSPSFDGSGVNSVVEIYENGELLDQLAINWD
ncbi:hypothetical protein D0T12_28010 [Actinomadura spongiicola]|uniref:Uncharacterized protein n=1 Tax=Actinomadura spongiicola TaxID=2303421 RepID=A0A372G9N2_9ACTN|nr:hypothetical protein D0T12_28010 [Actinomadura spongiicola]